MVKKELKKAKRKFSDEHRKNLSISHMGKKGYPTWKGKKFSKEHIENLSKSKKKYYALGNKPWNYIDGRSKKVTPRRYGKDWEKVRRFVLKRDKFTCQHCGLEMSGNTPEHDVHHKVPFLLSFDNSVENLMSLCRSCHIKEDAIIIKKMKGGMIKKCY